LFCSGKSKHIRKIWILHTNKNEHQRALAKKWQPRTTDVQKHRLHFSIFEFKMHFAVILMARDLLSLMSGIAGRSSISHQPAFLWQHRRLFW
jgi:hypothetical protein